MGKRKRRFEFCGRGVIAAISLYGEVKVRIGRTGVETSWLPVGMEVARQLVIGEPVALRDANSVEADHPRLVVVREQEVEA